MVRGAVIVVASCACACSLVVDLDGLRSDAATGTDSSPNDASSSDAPSDGASDVMTDATPGVLSFVQATADNYSAAGLSFSSPVADGDAVIIISENSVPGAVIASDTKGNSYATIVKTYSTLDGATVSMFVAFGVKGGFTTVHVSPPDGGTGYNYFAAEYRGIGVLDGTATGSTLSTGKDALVSSSVTETTAPELLFAYVHSGGTASPGTQFTGRSNFNGDLMEERIVTVAGTYQANATISDSTGDILFAAFH
jgi:hypothetical protein